MQLFHPLPSLLTTLAAVGFALLFGVHASDARLAGIFIIVLMTQLSISALNDWADRHRDAVAHRYRPVAVGRMSPRVALALAIVFGIGSLLGGLAFGLLSAFLVLIGLAAGWCYDLYLKPTPLSFLPFAIAFPLLPVWVGVASGRRLVLFIPVLIGGPLIALAIHLADSIPDRNIDERAGLRTLAIALGRPLAEVVAAVATVAATVMVVAFHWQPHDALPRIVLVLGPVAFVLNYLAFAFRNPNAEPEFRQTILKWDAIDAATQFFRWILILIAASVGLLLAIPADNG